MTTNRLSSAKDSLFEWLLVQYLTEATKKQIEAPVIRRPRTPMRADLKNIFLNYDGHAELNVADVRPTGFLVKARA